MAFRIRNMRRAACRSRREHLIVVVVVVVAAAAVAAVVFVIGASHVNNGSRRDRERDRAPIEQLLLPPVPRIASKRRVHRSPRRLSVGRCGTLAEARGLLLVLL